MKIAWFHSHLLNTNSGGTRYVTDYILYLSNHGYEIDLYCDQIDKSLKKDLLSKNVGIIELDNISTNSPLYWISLPLRIIKKRIFLKEKIYKYDSIVSSMFPMNIIVNNLSNKSLQVCFEPFAFFYDNDFLKQFKIYERSFFKIMSFLYSGLDKKHTKMSNKIVTVSQSSVDKIKTTYGVKSEIIRAGVDENRYKKLNKSKIDFFKNKYEGKPILLHSTDLSGAKGTESLIKVVELLLKDYPHLELLIVYYINNDKVYRDFKKKFSKIDNIKIVKAFPFNDLPEFYYSVDCIVQPNIGRSESWPLREALTVGTPFIGGSISEEASLTDNSLKVNINDVNDSYKKIKKFLSDLKRNKANSSNIYTIDYNGKKLIKILKSL